MRSCSSGRSRFLPEVNWSLRASSISRPTNQQAFASNWADTMVGRHEVVQRHHCENRLSYSPTPLRIASASEMSAHLAQRLLPQSDDCGERCFNSLLVIRTLTLRLTLRLYSPHPDRHSNAQWIFRHASRVGEAPDARLESILSEPHSGIKITVNRKLTMIDTYAPAITGFSPPKPAFLIHQAKPSPESSIGSIHRNRSVRPDPMSRNSAHMYSKSYASYMTIIESGFSCE